MRYKEFKYECEVWWDDDRRGHLGAAGLPTLSITAPPEFKGQPGAWTPEHFFVASINSCYWLTYVGIAEKKGLRLADFVSRGIGLLEFRDGGYVFTKVELFPEIEIASQVDLMLAEQLARQAEQGCLVARSVNCDVQVHPTISISRVEGVEPLVGTTE